MLTENDIVSKVTDYLRKSGYEIVQSLTTKEKGVDIIAKNLNHVLYIEAKGETSSMDNTNRFGSEFSPTQIISHVSRAIFASMAILHDKPAGPKTKVAIALPDNNGHWQLVTKIINPLRTLGIKVFWVTDDKVSEE